MNTLKFFRTQQEELSIALPVEIISSRAIIIRRNDKAIICTKHHKKAQYALPGGSIDNGENAEDAVMRELKEEGIFLIGENQNWSQKIAVDYYNSYKELAFWYIFEVDDAIIEETEENIETKWVSQKEDIWYPYLREKIRIHLANLAPHLLESNS